MTLLLASTSITENASTVTLEKIEIAPESTGNYCDTTVERAYTQSACIWINSPYF